MEKKIVTKSEKMIEHNMKQTLQKWLSEVIHNGTVIQTYEINLMTPAFILVILHSISNWQGNTCSTILHCMFF